jgi:hypothetical protein
MIHSFNELRSRPGGRLAGLGARPTHALSRTNQFTSTLLGAGALSQEQCAGQARPSESGGLDLRQG